MSDSIVAKSTGGLFPHSHTLEVKKSDLSNPPRDGVLLTTSVEYSLVFKHKHQVRITQQELAAIARGEEVTVRDTDKGRHSFKIRA